MHLSHDEFECVVEEALDTLPERFAALVENVVIVVEQEPRAEDRNHLAAGGELLGIYRGVPRPLRTHDMLPLLPDQIAIFRGPILRVSAGRRDVERQIRETVLHELGHYFGLDDDQMSY